MTNISDLQAQLDRINAELITAKNAEKILKKLKKTSLHSRTAHKYFDLQTLYMQTVQGK